MTKNRDIRHELEHRILLLDGGFGTMIQQYGLDEADYRGKEFAASEKLLRGCNDLLNLTRPETIREIHEKYLQAGSDVITSNTFNANSISLADYGLAAEAYRINRAGAAIAREAADAIVGDIVYKHFEGRREGFLTNTRSKIVQRETLNKLAVEIGLDKLVKYSTRSSSHNSYMYGNAFEALIGAIYLDQGYERCKQFMEEKILKNYIDLDKMSRKEVNFKSKLIEWSQKNKMEVSFELIEQSLDRDYNPMFHTEVLIENLPAGTGTGYSKKESQQNAAQMALKKIKNDGNFKTAIETAKVQNHMIEENTAAEENATDATEKLSEADSHTLALNN